MPKTAISIRIDNDLLAWLKDEAPHGYQSLIHDVLSHFRRRKELREQLILGRTRQIFLQYHAQCFWHMRRDLPIDLSHVPMIQDGLRKYGGIEGLRLAEELNPGEKE